jgi:hypothetical protein
MLKVIERPANSFLNARNVKLADILRQICDVYGENATSDETVRKSVRKFNEGCNKLHDEPRSVRPSVITGGRFLRGGDIETGALL